ncbi:Protein HAPLESS 2-A [Porphyridium purpureum]|uniref:Protein HAPLESS 2-A n=1 Tax=Porphyridium purpureum TaxID=35688 RepID=A0A5J4YWR1_PORPP|nr:Protein HAPLESS 2-A [Porphyridium purpureum]|eukprot:POR7452..scf227_4
MRMLSVDSSRHRLALVVLLGVTVMRLCVPSARAVVSGVGQIVQCLDEASTTNVSLTCEKKYIVTVALQNGALAGTEKLVFGSLTEKAGELDNADPNVGYKFRQRSEISMSRSKIVLRYPLFYLRDVNNKPFEVTKQTNTNGPFNWLYNPCRDGWEDDAASCGFFYDPPSSRNADDRVWDSQGFCCKCGLDDYLGTSNDAPRSAIECSFFSVFGGSSDYSAHCLRFGNLWYSAFEVRAPDVLYTVTLNITHCNVLDHPTSGDLPLNSSSSSGNNNNNNKKNNNNETNVTIGRTTWIHASAKDSISCYSEQVVVSPEQPILLASNGTLQVRLLGDYAAWQGTLDLSSKYFMWPVTCDQFTEECIARISRDPTGPEHQRWMLVDRHLVTLDGSECDKIGVAHSAYRNQANACEQPQGGCLRNQLEDYYQEDLEREAKGLKGSYFLSNFGMLSARDMFSQQPKLYFETERYQNAELLLSFAADALFTQVTVSPGLILNATILPFAAFSKDGLLRVGIENTGYRTAEYTLSSFCGPDIAPILAKSVFLTSRENKTVEFQVEAETILGGQHSCDVLLSDAIGQNVSSFRANFTSFSVDQDREEQGGESSGPQGSDSASTSGALQCLADCPSFFSITCFVRLGCWRNLLYLGLIGIIVLIIVFVVVKFGIPMAKKRLAKRRHQKELDEIRDAVEGDDGGKQNGGKPDTRATTGAAPSAKTDSGLSNARGPSGNHFEHDLEQGAVMKGTYHDDGPGNLGTSSSDGDVPLAYRKHLYTPSAPPLEAFDDHGTLRVPRGSESLYSGSENEDDEGRNNGDDLGCEASSPESPSGTATSQPQLHIKSRRRPALA